MNEYKVLVVEDNVTLEGDQLATWVGAAGYGVVGIAGTRAEAVELYGRHRPDIVFMDIHLGNDDPEGGIEAARAICRLRADCKIIYITGHRTPPERMEAVASTNPVGFVRKPLRKKDVVANLELAVALLQNKRFVFVCYSHQNTKIMEELNEYLKQLPHAGIEAWVDTQIKAGDTWKQEISLALQRARAAVVLVSIELMNSAFVRDIELPALLDTNRQLLVVPVFVNAVPQAVLEKSGLLHFHGINPPDRPLDAWPEAARRSEAWVPLFNRLAERVK